MYCSHGFKWPVESDTQRYKLNIACVMVMLILVAIRIFQDSKQQEGKVLVDQLQALRQRKLAPAENSQPIVALA